MMVRSGAGFVPATSFYTVRRTTDSDAKTNNTLASDTALLWTVAANEVWFFEAFLHVSAANTTMDAKFGWTYPTGTTMLWGTAGNGAELGGWGDRGTGIARLASVTEATTIAVGTLAGTSGTYLAGTVIVGGTAGTMTLQWAQNTTDAGELKLLKNSFLRLTKLA